MAVSRLLSQGIQHLKQHIDVIPLFVACTYAGALSLVMLGYTSLRKSDVVWNRWTTTHPMDKVDWTKPTQKILMTNSTDYAGYGSQFSEEKKLHQLIYGDGDYKL